jgi:hypothetical protein
MHDSVAQIQARIASLRSEIERQKAEVKSNLLDADPMAIAVKALRGLIVQLGALERKRDGQT